MIDDDDPWLSIDTAPQVGTFFVYMPNERAKIQVAVYHPNVKVIGNVFAFDLTKPSHWTPLMKPPKEFR